MNTYHVVNFHIDGGTSKGTSEAHDELERCERYATNKSKSNRIAKVIVVEAQGRNWGPLVSTFVNGQKVPNP